MSLQHSDGHRHLPVRLCDLKPEVLRHAALMAARQETDPTIVDLILHAALCPSDHVFYVHASAAPILRQAAT